ncbi:MAG: phosphatidate cytidylyltransferase [Mariprofundus sp.]|nr:phosphatidate cytidylyltransferase [Mariprofundus sp.]
MTELNKRIITAIVLVIVVWGWYFHLGSPWFERALALFGWLTSCELILLLKLRQPWLYMCTAFFTWLAFSFHADIQWLLLTAFIWFACFVYQARQQAPEFDHFFSGIWMLAWLFAFCLAIADTHLSNTGQGLIIGTCLAIWTSDIAAYFVGRACGKRKLCPAISPGKSVEGAIGGLVFAVPVAVGCWLYWDVLPLLPAILLAIIAVIAGMLGDLSESAVKRLIGAKDSGRWLPGHGGILDRSDAMLMAVPVTWLLWGLI